MQGSPKEAFSNLPIHLLEPKLTAAATAAASTAAKGASTPTIAAPGAGVAVAVAESSTELSASSCTADADAPFLGTREGMQYQWGNEQQHQREHYQHEIAEDVVKQQQQQQEAEQHLQEDASKDNASTTLPTSTSAAAAAAPAAGDGGSGTEASSRYAHLIHPGEEATRLIVILKVRHSLAVSTTFYCMLIHDSVALAKVEAATIGQVSYLIEYCIDCSLGFRDNIRTPNSG
jgi:hypothetical protein